MSNWAKLEGMPNVRVKEIVVQPEINKFVVATRGRGLWRGSIPCFVPGSDINITSNTTWNSDQMIPENVYVQQGAKLTISNCKISFAAGKKLVVEAGSELYLDGAVLTSRCTEKWAGIEVWGDKNETQTTEFQGKLEMYNSTIEHAHEAVQLWKPGDYNKTGGMIYAEDSEFFNNHRAISALSYKNLHPVFGIESDYSAIFTRCTFKSDGSYMDDNPFYSFVTMWKVRGIKFNACEFDGGEYNGWGIIALDAGFHIKSICNGVIGPDGCLPEDLERCEFIGFDKAISAQNTLSASPYPINIQHAYFYNNNYGAFFNGIQNLLNVKSSEFFIGNNGETKEKVLCGSFSGRGIHIQASTGFSIENNEFKKMPDAGSSDDIIGIVALGNPSDHDIIYKNTFSELKIANKAEGNNRERENDLVGIEYQCNENSGNGTDFEVVGIVTDAKINPDLGHANLSAHNSFSQFRVQWNWRNMGSEREYYYLHDSELGTVYEPSNIKIETTDNDPLLFNKEEATLIHQCPDDGGIHEERIVLTAGEQQDLETEYAIGYNDYQAVEIIYNDLKDGGSTEGTSLTIASAQPDDTWELRDNLLGKSPHLSKLVLMEAADKTDVLPNSILLDILAANPDELKKEDFIQYLENKDEPLPSYMISILRDLSAGITYKTSLLNQMSLHKRKQVVSAKQIINSLINEDEQDPVAIKNWLGNLKSRKADIQIASILINEENYTDAIVLLEMIPDLYNLQGEALNLYLDDKYMVSLEMNLKQDSRNITQLNSSEIGQLEIIADNETGAARSSARIILESFYGYNDYCDCLSDNENKSATTSDVFNKASDSPLSISANPNPATHYVEFIYQLSEIDDKGIIIITDISGKQIQSFSVEYNKGVQAWDTRKIPAGSYIYTLKTKYFEESGKLIIQ